MNTDLIKSVASPLRFLSLSAVVMLAGTLFGQTAQQSATLNGPFDPAAYANIRTLTADASGGWATIGVQTASNDGNNGHANVTAYNLYRGPNGDWWAAHLHTFATDDDNGDSSGDTYGADLGYSALPISCDNGTSTPSTGCSALYGAGGIPYGHLDAANNGGGSLARGAKITLVGWAGDLANPSAATTVEIFDVIGSDGAVPYSAAATGTSQTLPNVWAFPSSYLGGSPLVSFTVPGSISRPDVVATYQLSGLGTSGWVTTIDTSSFTSGAYHTMFAFAVSNGTATCIGSTEFYLGTGSVPASFTVLQPSWAKNVPITLAWQTSASGSLSLSGSGISGSASVAASGTTQVSPSAGSASWSLTGAPSGTLTGSATVSSAYQAPLAIAASIGHQITGSATVGGTDLVAADTWVVPAGQAVTFSFTGGSGSGSSTWYSSASSSYTTGSSRTVTFATPGYYTLTLTNNGDSSYLASESLLTVYAVPTPSISSFTLTPSSTVPYQGTIAYSVSDSAGFSNLSSGLSSTSVTVTGGGASFSGSSLGSQTYSLSGLTQGTFTYTLTATDPFGLGTTSTWTATVSPIAQTLYTSPVAATLVAGQSLIVQVIGGHTSYTWGGSGSGTGTSTSVTFPSPGSYSISVSAASGAGYAASGTVTVPVTVIASPTGSGTNLVGKVTYGYFGSTPQNFAAPSGANEVFVKAWGAGGGWDVGTVSTGSGGGPVHGGSGALSAAAYGAVPGDGYTIVVGGGGSGSTGSGVSGSGGWPGGGNGLFAAGGGGYSEVIGPRGTVIAGGGGGAGSYNLTDGSGGNYGNGGSAGVPNGAAGNSWANDGAGATATAGGLGGSATSNPGLAGALNLGGNGNAAGGGGGGGGAYGGGGGGDGSGHVGSGGGGSSAQTGSPYNSSYAVGGASDPNYPGSSVAVGGSSSSAPNGGDGAVVFLAYSASPAGALETQVFYPNSAGTAQSFTVPAGAAMVVVKAWGAGGQSDGGAHNAGGAGAFASVSYTVSGGESFSIVPGRAPTNPAYWQALGGEVTKVGFPAGGTLYVGAGGGAGTAAGGQGGAGGTSAGQTGGGGYGSVGGSGGGSSGSGSSLVGVGGVGGAGDGSSEQFDGDGNDLGPDHQGVGQTGSTGFAQDGGNGGGSGDGGTYLGGGGGGGLGGGGGGGGGDSSGGGGGGGGGSSGFVVGTRSPLASSFIAGSGATPPGTTDLAYPSTGVGVGGTAGGAGGTGAVVIEVYPAAPTFTSVATQAGQPGQAVDFLPTLQNAPLSFSATGLPTGLTINPVTGEITGTPSSAGTYSVTLTATNATGSGTTTFTWIVDATAPSAPSSLASGGVTDTGFSLSWSAPSDTSGISRYEVSLNGTSQGTTSLPSFVLSGLSPSTIYAAQVRACDGAGNWSSWTSALNVTTAADTSAPTTPGGLNVNPLGSTSLTLKWGAGSDDVGVVSYTVEKNGSTVGTTSGMAMAFTGLSAGSTYTFNVKAGDAAGNSSSWSATLSVTMPTATSDTLLGEVAFGPMGNSGQAYTVPAGANYVIVKVWGAGGGAGTGANGSNAPFEQSYLNVKGGDGFTIVVGSGGGAAGPNPSLGGSPPPGQGGLPGGFPGNSYYDSTAHQYATGAGGGGYSSVATPYGTIQVGGGAGQGAAVVSGVTCGYGGLSGAISEPSAAYNETSSGEFTDPWYPGNGVAKGGVAGTSSFGGEGAVVILAYQSAGSDPTQKFIVGGVTSTYTVPADTSSLEVKVWGAGGGGNSGPSTSGGGGAYVTATYPVTPGETITLTPGTGGIGNSLPAAGVYGGGHASVVSLPGGATLYAAGGGGAGSAAGGNGGAGGASAGGTGGGGYGSCGGAGGSTSGSGSSLVGVGGTGGAGDGSNDDGNVGIGTSGSNGGGYNGGMGGDPGDNGSYQGGDGGGGIGGGGGGGGGDSSAGGGGGGGGSSGIVLGSRSLIASSLVAGSGATPGNNSDSYYPALAGVGGASINGSDGAVVVIAHASVPVISSSSTKSGTQNVSLSYTITATYAPTIFAASGLPAGLTLNPATGVISGTVTTAGTYTSTITAGNRAGNSSSFTLTWTVAADASAPSVPTGLSVSNVTPYSFTLTWSSSTDNVAVTQYQLQLNGTTVGTVSGTSSDVTGLTPGTTYLAAVRAGDAAGNWSSWSSTLSVPLSSDTAAPNVVTGVASVAASSNAVTLVWSPSSDNFAVTGYKIYRNGSLVGTASSLSFVDVGLTASTSYSYAVTAFDAAGNASAASTSLNITTAASSATDSDHDGIPDAIESLLGTNPSSAATIDSSNSLQVIIHHPSQ